MTETTPLVLECGKSIDELSDYVSTNRTPRDEAIETCPECLSALAGLERIGRLSRDLISHDAVQLPETGESWITGIIENIASEVRSGRSLPLRHDNARIELSVTEGAVRALIRSVGDEIDGVVIGRCHLDGAAEIPDAPVEVTVTASLLWGMPAQQAGLVLRARIGEALRTHTELTVTAINIEINELHGPFPDTEVPS